MGCCSSDREKGPRDESQKWDFITLSDFRCTSAWTYFAYGWLWFLAIVGVAVYVVDTFTAVQLLAYDNWSSQVKPKVPFKYSKWIFAVCIIISWVLCFYEWIRAIRVIRRGGVAESFLDPLAVDLQSMRSQGWKRFLVFSALAKSKKGADYVALFVYFSFKTSIRVILAEGPRQVVNALTLWAVLQSDIAVKHATDHSSFEQFWLNIGVLAERDKLQACIYFAMLFTLVIWVFSALSLIISVILYLVFLWHYIPSRDGRLSVYCKRKVDRRLAKVVEHKVKAAIEEEEREARKAEQKAEQRRQKNGELPPPPSLSSFKRQPTLPEIGRTPSSKSTDKVPDFYGISRQNTETTLPPYTSRPSTSNDAVTRQPTLPNVGNVPRRPVLRTETQGSVASAAPSYASNAPLMSNTGFADNDYNHYDGPLPPLPHMRSESQSTLNSQRSYRPGGLPGGPPGPGPRMPPQRSNTGFSFEQIQQPLPPQPGYPRAPPQAAYNPNFTRPTPGGPPGMPSRAATADIHPQQFARRALPERSATAGPPPDQQYEMRISPVHTVPTATYPPAPSRSVTNPVAGGYHAFNPSANPSMTSVLPPPSYHTNAPSSTYASSIAPTMRSATAPPPQFAYTTNQPQQTNWQTWQQPSPLLPPLPAQGGPQGQERPYHGPVGPGSIRRPEPPQGGGPRAATGGPRW
ncbi:unnamed protein product [Zymoseptoria tritici ST99CH_1A5]|uniref:Vacuolar membrane protein n=2 Tax=Zymoseptoria tritici TaxID=1047171 RepID=F9X9D6_ZYMTI|nr:uncharacterized protein MYCGRDRAFT_70800 [Zymoseptoria tritici IPO323]EGP88506.1 hypothetical protein MYCGRDRAFT_70800 [Zymoseptoria tritici IPO323]SMY23360.1 unnamed protein product [Zymoseptoria tritici ST99CH_1A5]